MLAARYAGRLPPSGALLAAALRSSTATEEFLAEVAAADVAAVNAAVKFNVKRLEAGFARLSRIGAAR